MLMSYVFDIKNVFIKSTFFILNWKLIKLIPRAKTHSNLNILTTDCSKWLRRIAVSHTFSFWHCIQLYFMSLCSSASAVIFSKLNGKQVENGITVQKKQKQTFEAIIITSVHYIFNLIIKRLTKSKWMKSYNSNDTEQKVIEFVSFNRFFYLFSFFSR